MYIFLNFLCESILLKISAGSDEPLTFWGLKYATRRSSYNDPGATSSGAYSLHESVAHAHAHKTQGFTCHLRRGRLCNKSCQTVLQVKRLLSVLFYAFLSLSTASKRVVSESKDSQFCFAPLKQWLRNLCQTCTTTIQRRDSLAGGFTRPSIVVIPDWVGCTSSACQFWGSDKQTGSCCAVTVLRLSKRNRRGSQVDTVVINFHRTPYGANKSTGRMNHNLDLYGLPVLWVEWNKCRSLYGNNKRT